MVSENVGKTASVSWSTRRAFVLMIPIEPVVPKYLKLLKRPKNVRRCSPFRAWTFGPMICFMGIVSSMLGNVNRGLSARIRWPRVMLRRAIRPLPSPGICWSWYIGPGLGLPCLSVSRRVKIGLRTSGHWSDRSTLVSWLYKQNPTRLVAEVSRSTGNFTSLNTALSSKVNDNAWTFT